MYLFNANDRNRFYNLRLAFIFINTYLTHTLSCRNLNYLFIIITFSIIVYKQNKYSCKRRYSVLLIFCMRKGCARVYFLKHLETISLNIIPRLVKHNNSMIISSRHTKREQHNKDNPRYRSCDKNQ